MIEKEKIKISDLDTYGKVILIAHFEQKFFQMIYKISDGLILTQYQIMKNGVSVYQGSSLKNAVDIYNQK